MVEKNEIDRDSIYLVPVDADVPVYLRANRDEIYKFIFDRYKTMVHEELEHIDLFLYGDFLMGVKRKDVERGIKNTLDYFVESEQYELAKEAHDLILTLSDSKHGT